MARRPQDIVGRKAKMLRWIEENEPDYERIKRGKIIFHFAGKEVYVEVSGAKQKI